MGVGRCFARVFGALSFVLLIQPLDGVVVFVHFRLLRSKVIVTESVQRLELLDFFSKLVLGGLEAEVIFFVMSDVGV